jgi:CRISPR-associated endonuclease/helicase Cas3
MTFETWFERATGKPPFPYQTALATGEALPDQLSVPTGLGKTAAAILSWLWRRRHAGPQVVAATPRRLVFSLPVRTLVEQTAREVATWLANLDLTDAVGVYTLMGGAVADGWDGAPDGDAVLIGTQDQLLSRALNRGYAMSRFRWPIHFAWLNNDALWVFDEVQLMGVGASTGAQLQGLRDALGTHRPTATLWMTATPSPGRLRTVDGRWPLRPHGLTDADRAHPVAAQRLGAQKRLVVVPAEGKHESARWPTKIVEQVLAHHQDGGRTLVVVNQVQRAQAVFELLRKRKVPTALLHSRFRAADRAATQALALDRAFQGVIVATQAIEAGVDLSCSTLITEAAPWSSFVQRVGRCNRYGEHAEATVVWMALPADDKVTAPYTAAQVEEAQSRLTDGMAVGPAALAALGMPDAEPDLPVLRRRDLLGLFDTEADLSGLDLDVSGYIRDADDADVAVAWRSFEADEGPSAHDPAPHRDELCRVRVDRLRDLLKKARAWRWDSLEGAWIKADPARVTPGMTLLLPTTAGGYDEALGYTGDPAHTPAPVERAGRPIDHDESDSADPLTRTGAYITLAMHSEDTARALAALAARLPDATDTPWPELLRAARWHDVGKAHPVFQAMLTAGLEADDARRSDGPWAKSDGEHGGRCQRPHFRHELASALVLLAEGGTDLQAYVVAAHHGKARLTVRSRPTERDLHGRGKPILGVLDGDEVPGADLGGGEQSQTQRLSLDLFSLGGGATGASWMARMQALLAALGPFRLAWCEALVRVADWEASRARMSGELDAVGGAD